MTAIFEMPLPSETLDPEELERITGSSRKADQTEWLTTNGWCFHRNKAGVPVVGRMYARLRMLGVNPASMVAPGGWAPDFSKLG